MMDVMAAMEVVCSQKTRCDRWMLVLEVSGGLV